MHLIYIDESGQPSFSDTENYVLASLCIHEKDWQTIDNTVKELKLKYFPHLNPDDVEFHIKEIVGGKKLYSTLDFESRINILTNIYKLIANIDCSILAVLIDKTKAYSHNFDVNYWGFKLLFERLCIWLEKENQEHIDRGEPTEHAILLIDSVNNKYDLKIRKRLLPWIRGGTGYRTNKFIIEDPIFVTSSYRNLSQLVDAVAYCVRRYIRTSNKIIDNKFDTFWSIISGKFDTNKAGNIINAGLKIFPM